VSRDLCPRCSAPLVRAATGRPRKWCRDACKVAAHRERAHATHSLTVADLVARTGAPASILEESLHQWLERGVVQRVNGGYAASPEWVGRLSILRGVPLESDDDDGIPSVKPGPRRKAAA